MILLLQLIMRPRVLFVLGIAAAIGLAGARIYHAGAESVRQKWQAADAERERVAIEQHAEDQRQANRADAQYESQRQQIEVRHASVSAALKQSLSAPIRCSAAPLALGNVPVSAAVINSLRDAGADADSPAAAQR